MKHSVTKPAILVAAIISLVLGTILYIKNIPAAIGIATLTGWVALILFSIFNSNELKRTTQQQS